MQAPADLVAQSFFARPGRPLWQTLPGAFSTSIEAEGWFIAGPRFPSENRHPHFWKAR
jgi:hypothetical protein